MSTDKLRPAALPYDDVREAADRIRGWVRPVAVAQVEPGALGTPAGCSVWLALEHLQFTGSFKARGAQNFLTAHAEQGTLPDAGVTIASGGNAGLACAWAARAQGVRATVFVPATAPEVKVRRLREYGADVRLVGSEYAEALAACQQFASTSGALTSHAYDHPLIAAGAGTVLDEIRAQVRQLDTVVVAVGGGGLFAGVAAAAQQHGIRTVAVEPRTCRALNAALEAGQPVDVPVASVAADSLGARRASAMALAGAQRDDVHSLLVDDEVVVEARRTLWEDRRLVVEHAAATAVAALAPAGGGPAYAPSDGERIAVVLCGGNTDPSDLAR